MKIWVVLPAYNEENAITPLLDSLVENLKEGGWQYSIIVVNDGSKDETGEIIESYAKRESVIPLHNNPNQGLAETLKRGLLKAMDSASDKDIIVTLDADNTHPAGLVLRMIRLIREGNDIVIASRYREGSHVRGVPFSRLILSVGSSWLFRVFFPIRGVKDYTCGYRAYRASAIRSLMGRYGKEFISERGFSCMVDILLRLRQEGLVFVEVPLVLRYDLKSGKSKMKVVQTIADTLLLLVRRRLGRA